jgi:hypothetical protein
VAIGKSDYDILCDLKNKQSISEVLTRNCQGLDRADSDLFLSTYHEDALVEVDDFCGSPATYYELNLTGSRHTVLESLHFVSNVFIEVDEMTRTIAACESYYQVITRIQNRNKIIDCIEYGRYVDHLECRTIKERCRMGVWKISRRKVLPSSDRLEPVMNRTQNSRNHNNLTVDYITDKAVLSFFKRATVPMVSRILRTSPTR